MYRNCHSEYCKETIDPPIPTIDEPKIDSFLVDKISEEDSNEAIGVYFDADKGKDKEMVDKPKVNKIPWPPTRFPQRLKSNKK